MVADDLAVDLQRLALADLDADGAVEFECASAGGDFGVAVDHADLLTQLVDKDSDAVALVDRAGELSERLRHQTGVQTNVAVAHFAFDLRLGNERCDGVDNDHVDRAGTDQSLGDLKRVLTGVGLSDEQFVDIHAQRLRINRIKRVLDVDERDVAAVFLTFGNTVQGERRLTGGLGTVDLHDPAARQTADTQCDIQGKGAGRDVLHVHVFIFAQAHDRALAKLLFKLLDRCVQRCLLVNDLVCRLFLCLCHTMYLRSARRL